MSVTGEAVLGVIPVCLPKEWRRKAISGEDSPGAEWSHCDVSFLSPYLLTLSHLCDIPQTYMETHRLCILNKHLNSYRWADTPGEIYEYISHTSVILQARFVISDRDQSILFRTKPANQTAGKKQMNKGTKNKNMSVDRDWIAIACPCFVADTQFIFGVRLFPSLRVLKCVGCS